MGKMHPQRTKLILLIASFSLSLCGVVTLVSIYLPWAVHTCGVDLLCEEWQYSLSQLAEIAEWMGAGALPQPTLILIGSICIIVFSLLAFIVEIREGSRKMVCILSFSTTLAAILVLAGALWAYFAVEELPINPNFDYGIGFYLTSTIAVLVIVVGIVAALLTSTSSRIREEQ